ncbi:hypothetical protein F4810DRAFT_19450 [Camillea tinctor]|nr:hypothetical protein F4810DRAFT_19450 [Camillea tinctor]
MMTVRYRETHKAQGGLNARSQFSYAPGNKQASPGLTIWKAGQCVSNKYAYAISMDEAFHGRMNQTEFQCSPAIVYHCDANRHALTASPHALQSVILLETHLFLACFYFFTTIPYTNIHIYIYLYIYTVATKKRKKREKVNKNQKRQRRKDKDGQLIAARLFGKNGIQHMKKKLICMTMVIVIIIIIVIHMP